MIGRKESLARGVHVLVQHQRPLQIPPLHAYDAQVLLGGEETSVIGRQDPLPVLVSRLPGDRRGLK